MLLKSALTLFERFTQSEDKIRSAWPTFAAEKAGSSDDLRPPLK